MRDRSGWRYVVTQDGRSMRLEHETWEAARQHVDYMHKCHQGHIFGITRFFRKRKPSA